MEIHIQKLFHLIQHIHRRCRPYTYYQPAAAAVDGGSQRHCRPTYIYLGPYIQYDYKS